jgi:hypothetical protein
MPKRGPKWKLGYHCVCNLILWGLYTGMQWKCLPIPHDTQGKPAIHSTTVYQVFARWANDGSLGQEFVASVRHLAAEQHLDTCCGRLRGAADAASAAREEWRPAACGREAWATRAFGLPSMLPLLSSPRECFFPSTLSAVSHDPNWSGGFRWRWDPSVANDLLSVRAHTPVTRCSLRLATRAGRPVGGDPISPTASVQGPEVQRAASTRTKSER